ncbi:hypothetical protein PVL29_027240 [Vitis rotundifolia]|uniref:Uncharacterized protein n=1 Tax=Vitis rotundifolia TaxID=103349 RepID=A0AA38YIM3_VITRO|nr:hypothetical protein PVL29_027240 [Vitis rotundifolia]
MEVRPLTKKKQNKGGKNGLSSKLVVTPPSVLILPFLPYPKARDVESIPFHGLGEMVPISGDDFTLSTQTPPTTHIDPPTSNINKFFPILETIPMDVTIDP